MRDHKAGLYTPATIETWLLATGLASPPVLVLLGLTLPDSRILNGMAGVGLTLANIADLRPYLRQPTIDTTHANYDTHTHGISTLKDGVLSSAGSHSMQEALPSQASLAFRIVSPWGEEHLCAGADGPSCLTHSKPSNRAAFDRDWPLALPAPLLLLRKEEDEQVPAGLKSSSSSNANEIELDTDDAGVLDGRAALFTPLPAPDAIEDALFASSSVVFTKAPQKGGSANSRVGVIHPAADTKVVLDITKQSRLSGHVSSTLFTRDTPGYVSWVTSACGVNQGTTIRPKTCIEQEDGPEGGAICSDGPAAQHYILESVQMIQRVEAKREPRRLGPESLVFVPQSVIKRFPSAPLVSAAPHYGIESFIHDYQSPSVSLVASIDKQSTSLPLKQGTGTSIRASGVIGERSRPPQSSQREDILSKKVEVTAEELPVGGQDLVPDSAAGQIPCKKAPPQSVHSPPGSTQKVPALKLKSSHRESRPRSGRRLGVLARAALRNRRYKSRTSDNSRSTDSYSESDSDSQYSGDSSAEESMLPRMLGSDLIAAIDANSEWELNLYGSSKTAPPPADSHEEFAASQDSIPDVSSLVMLRSSTIHASDADVRGHATSRSLTYEDIQNWATGVVHTCGKQVHRNHAPVPPRSPSQASDVCAERPLIPGVSRCPLAGHHCGLGASATEEARAPKITKTPASEKQPAHQSQQSRKPLVVRNIRDIPEFVPRQRRVPVVISMGVENPPRLRTRSMFHVAPPQARDVAGELIARMESRAGFDTRGRKETGANEYWGQPAGGQLERHVERSRFRLA